MKRLVFLGTLVFLLLAMSILPLQAHAETYYISQTLGSDTQGDGTQAHPWATIGKAVSIAADGSTIEVAAGAYGAVTLTKQLNLLGGYDPATWQRNVPVFRTVIDGQGASAAISINFPLISDDVSLDGFVIRNNGGIGIDVNNTTATISNNIIENNDQGIRSYASYFSYAWSLIYLNNNLIIHNQTGVWQEALAYASCPVAHCLYRSAYSYLISTNDTIADNQEYGVKQVKRLDGPPEFEFLIHVGSVIRNSIIAENPGNYLVSQPFINYSDFGGPIGSGGTGMIDADPLFWDETQTDHGLRPGSPCIDAGDPATQYNDPDGSRNDMGFTGGNSSFSDTDHDGMPDLWEVHYGLNPLEAADAVLDCDSDGKTNREEYYLGTDPGICSDSDGDGMPDIYETMYSCLMANTVDGNLDPDGDGLTSLVEYQNLIPTDPCNPDTDGDGLDDAQELNVYLTDPLNPDTDGDGLSDGQEVGLGTSPTSWDTDGDLIPDDYEVANEAGATPLDPLNAADGPEDFDGDGNSNVNEYWNGTDPWAKDPVPDPFYPGSPGCYYWGEGDGDGYVLANDKSILLSEVLGMPQSYDNVLPKGLPDVQDLDADGYILAGDLSILKSFIVSSLVGGIGSRAAVLEKVYEPLSPVAVGGTAHVTVRVRNSNVANNLYQAGFSVVFSIDPSSTGSAVLLGGDGADGPGTRFAVSGPSGASDGGHATIHMKITAPGTIIVNASIPACGTSGVGRWVDQVTLDPVFTIMTQ